MKMSTGLLISTVMSIVANLIFPIEDGNIIAVMFLCAYAIVGAIEELQK